MKRIVIILAGLALLTAGCAGKPKAIYPKAIYQATNEPGYVQGFIDGYLSAHPDQPYARDARADYHGSSYRQGWETGRTTGKKDERQRP